AVAIQLASSFLPRFLQDVHGVALGGIGLLDSVKAAGAIAVGLAVGRLQRAGEPLAAGALALAMIGVGLGGVLIASQLTWFVAVYLLLGGVWLTFSSYCAAMGSAAPEAVRSRAFAFVELGIGVGSSLGPLVAGVLYGLDPRAPIVAALFAAVGLLGSIG